MERDKARIESMQTMYSYGTKAEKNPEFELMEEIAASVFKSACNNPGLFAVVGKSVEDFGEYKSLANGIAKVSWDFADSFMRERYERASVKATGIKLDDLFGAEVKVNLNK